MILDSVNEQISGDGRREGHCGGHVPGQNHEHGKVREAAKVRKRGGFDKGEMKVVFENGGVRTDFDFEVIAKALVAGEI